MSNLTVTPSFVYNVVHSEELPTALSLPTSHAEYFDLLDAMSDEELVAAHSNNYRDAHLLIEQEGEDAEKAYATAASRYSHTFGIIERRVAVKPAYRHLTRRDIHAWLITATSGQMLTALNA